MGRCVSILHSVFWVSRFETFQYRHLAEQNCYLTNSKLLESKIYKVKKVLTLKFYSLSGGVWWKGNVLLPLCSKMLQPCVCLPFQFCHFNSNFAVKCCNYCVGFDILVAILQWSAAIIAFVSSFWWQFCSNVLQLLHLFWHLVATLQ